MSLSFNTLNIQTWQTCSQHNLCAVCGTHLACLSRLRSTSNTAPSSPQLYNKWDVSSCSANCIATQHNNTPASSSKQKRFYDNMLKVNLWLFSWLQQTIRTLCAEPRCCSSFLVDLQTPVTDNSARRTWPSRAHVTRWVSPVYGTNFTCAGQHYCKLCTKHWLKCFSLLIHS